MFVSESKFRSAPADFIPHILASPPNKSALEALITKPEVEARLLVRLANKARVYGCEMDADGHIVAVPDAEGSRGKIDIEHVVGLYRDWVIPLTKDVEVSGLGCVKYEDGGWGKSACSCCVGLLERGRGGRLHESPPTRGRSPNVDDSRIPRTPPRTPN